MSTFDEKSIHDLCHGLAVPRTACYFYKVDLHVHSPGSHDFAQAVPTAAGERSKLRRMSATEFVKCLLDAGLELVAITDHHAGDFLDPAIEAAAAIQRKTGRALTILPGVELTVVPGIHVLAILPSGGTEAIHDLLSALGLKPGDRGREDALIDKSISDVGALVHERGGLLIGAHCNSKKGVVKQLEGLTRTKFLQALDALEHNAEARNIEKTTNYVRKDLRSNLPFIFSSDSHDPRSMPDTMWLKMAEPTFVGLRQLIFEPELRVSRESPATVLHPHIIGCGSTAGIYGSEVFSFSPHLNALIGGRGAGKSALIDLIRFTLEEEPEDEVERKHFAVRIASFLKRIGHFLVCVMRDGGEVFAIVRSGAFQVDRRKGPQFSEQAKVYQLTSDSAVLRNLSPRDVILTEFYGQGEVHRLADRAHEQLRLVDDNLDLQAELADVKSIEQVVLELERRILLDQERIEELEGEISERGDLQIKADQLGKGLDDPVFRDRTRWRVEQDHLEAVTEWLDRLAKVLVLQLPIIPSSVVEADLTPSKELLDQVAQRILQLRTGVEEALALGDKLVTEGRQEVAVLVDHWEQARQAADELYRVRLAELGAENLAAIAEEHNNVCAKLTRIETVLIPERDQLKGQVDALMVQRGRDLETLFARRAAITQARCEQAAALNAQLGGAVRIEFDLVGDRTSYFDTLSAALDRTGIINKEDQLTRVCTNLLPIELVQAVRSRDAERFSTVGLTPGTIDRLLSHLSQATCMELERIDMPPKIRVLLRREGEEELSTLEQLSVGEKCSAILSIALLNKHKPLIIDQPEDDLDHAFVTESIVESIRRVKHLRQIITATHNPNIPVLGDAEMVFRLARRPGDEVCYIKASGGLELATITAEVQLLEGGASAFERRRARYGPPA